MYQKIVVPVDGSELAECVIPHVETIARATQAVVELVEVIEPLKIPTRGGIALSEEDLKQIELQTYNEVQNYLAKITETLRSKDIEVHSKAIKGKAAESIVDYARSINADLIIMATHGRSGISRWVWGSVADRILHASHTPVLLIRAPGSAPAI